MEIVLTIIKDIVVGIYQRVGIRGIVIAALLAVIMFENHRIGNYQTEVTNLNNTITSQAQSIEKQNGAIIELGKARGVLQGQLDAAVESNAKLSVRFEVLKKKISSQPVAITCDGAIAEIRSTAKDVAEKWNAQ